MLILVSPAKTLDFETPAKIRTATQPVFLEQSALLVDELQKLSAKKLSSLMGISPKLGELNQNRFNAWQTPFSRKNAKQAALAFKGDVYTGLEAESFSESDLKFAQQHLRILSGLYGVLRPLDLMQPYRLEMGTKFPNQRGKNLYEFWGDSITEAINKQLKSLHADTVVNLASNEYFRAVNKDLLEARIISPAFRDLSKGQYKMISFYAKKARGQMAAWIIKKGLTDPAQLKKFNVAGYRYNADLSKPDIPTFTRDKVPG
ncbi:MAG: peroxide stress protein YaaA [Gammaproteobacteria bacterium]|jgi:cytoplasmic iron level regulating protein YaaA (DUF328/UPF0246 family)